MPITPDKIERLKEHAWQLRRDIVDVTEWAGGAHIGGALSMVEMMVILYEHFLNIDPKNPDWEDRDRVVVSKGHAGVGIAPMLARRGYFDFQELRTFNHFQSAFGMHLDCRKVPGVDVSSGSLGHGLSIAAGMALGARLQSKPFTTYCILGDGECNEGSIWEAAMSIAHFRLTNLVTMVDRNQLMIDGPTEQVMALEPFADKWRAFGFEVREVDGHDFAALGDAIESARSRPSAPMVLIAHTVKGKGVDYMENEVKWQYGNMNSELSARARTSIDRMHGIHA